MRLCTRICFACNRELLVSFHFGISPKQEIWPLCAMDVSGLSMLVVLMTLNRTSARLPIFLIENMQWVLIIPYIKARERVGVACVLNI